MAFASIALDLSAGYESRRQTINAADAAALAAAWEDCNPKVANNSNPTAAALEIAALNGFDNADANVAVVVDEPVDGEFRVTISTNVDASFGAAGGIDGDGQFNVVSQATAACKANPFLGGYALLAFAPDSCGGGVELDLSGASKIINGGLHSNGDIKITGASTEINGVVTFIGSSNYNPSQQLSAPPPNPLGEITFGELAPGGPRAATAITAGNYINATGNNITNDYMTAIGYATGTGGNITIIKSGIYYTDGSISLNSASVSAGIKVTFVANGQISVNGSGNFIAYENITGTDTDPGLLMHSNHLSPANGGPTCTGNAIQWSVSSGTWTGVIYAPNGQAKQSTASNATLNGSIFAYTVDLSGSEFNISWQDNPDAIPTYEVELIR